MSEHPDNTHHVRRVVLPSGKTIEVVYFADQVAPANARREPDQRADQVDLHVCTECSSELVYPIDWEESGTSHWEVTLRCPNCEWSETGRWAQPVVERFDEELDRGTELLVRALKRLVQANMEDEIERFTEALGRDQILPEDF